MSFNLNSYGGDILRNCNCAGQLNPLKPVQVEIYPTHINFEKSGIFLPEDGVINTIITNGQFALGVGFRNRNWFVWGLIVGDTAQKVTFISTTLYVAFLLRRPCSFPTLVRWAAELELDILVQWMADWRGTFLPSPGAQFGHTRLDSWSKLDHSINLRGSLSELRRTCSSWRFISTWQNLLVSGSKLTLSCCKN